jgi:hypothetical protein
MDEVYLLTRSHFSPSLSLSFCALGLSLLIFERDLFVFWVLKKLDGEGGGKVRIIQGVWNIFFILLY